MNNLNNNEKAESMSSTETPSMYERSLAVVIMLIGAIMCLGLIGIMIAQAEFNIKMLFGVVVVGPGAIAFGWSCFNKREFWKRRLGKWVKILAPLLLLLLIGIAVSEGK